MDFNVGDRVDFRGVEWFVIEFLPEGRVVLGDNPNNPLKFEFTFVENLERAA